jgi:hypothetical protein
MFVLYLTKTYNWYDQEYYFIVHIIGGEELISVYELLFNIP